MFIHEKALESVVCETGLSELSAMSPKAVYVQLRRIWQTISGHSKEFDKVFLN